MSYEDVDVISDNVLKTYDKITKKLKSTLNKGAVSIMIRADQSIISG